MVNCNVEKFVYVNVASMDFSFCLEAAAKYTGRDFHLELHVTCPAYQRLSLTQR